MKTACWLMERFGVPKALTGDLVEAARGRSCLWLWRQALAALLSSASRDVLTHPALVARALVVAWSLHWVFGRLRRPVMFAMAGSQWTSWKIQYWLSGLVGAPVPPLSILTAECFGALITGWVVSRLHRPYGLALVSVYVASLMIFFGGGFLNSWPKAFFAMGPIGLVINSVFLFVVVPAAVLIGALAGSVSSAALSD